MNWNKKQGNLLYEFENISIFDVKNKIEKYKPHFAADVLDIRRLKCW